jgi:hypothetical protein
MCGLAIQDPQPSSQVFHEKNATTSATTPGTEVIKVTACTVARGASTNRKNFSRAFFLAPDAPVQPRSAVPDVMAEHRTFGTSHGCAAAGQ